MTFGEKLKTARTEAGLKQAELAKQLNTTGNTISNWENNVSKPDLDMLSYICGALHVNASYLLKAKLPEDEVNIKELAMVKKYRDLDSHGKKMVDFTLQEEWERSTAAGAQVLNFPDQEPEHLMSNAAHVRTDIEIPDGVDTSEDSIMDDEDF